MNLNKFPANTMAQLAQCFSGDEELPSRFTDPTDVYYRTIHLRSCHQTGDYVYADGHRITAAELAGLHRCHPGDIVVDGVVHGVVYTDAHIEMNDLY